MQTLLNHPQLMDCRRRTVAARVPTEKPQVGPDRGSAGGGPLGIEEQP
jgi:hypothetical protein